MTMYFQLFKYIPFNQLRLSDYKLTNDRRITDQLESRFQRKSDFGTQTSDSGTLDSFDNFS